MNPTFPAFLLGAVMIAASVSAEPATITVSADKPSHKVAPTLWGVFFEDINLSADGGLYAELLRNRSFEDSDELQNWQLVESSGSKATATVTCELPWAENPLSTRNKRSLKLQVDGSGGAGVSNSGYWGIPVKAGATYHLSFAARCPEAAGMTLTASLESKDGKSHGSAEVKVSGGQWAVSRVDLKSGATDADARLVLRGKSAGTVFLDMVSLFPAATWKARANGLRADLAEMLVGLYPAFVRFPGGCWVEGDTMKESYRWKETMGPLQAGCRTEISHYPVSVDGGVPDRRPAMAGRLAVSSCC